MKTIDVERGEVTDAKKSAILKEHLPGYKKKNSLAYVDHGYMFKKHRASLIKERQDFVVFATGSLQTIAHGHTEYCYHQKRKVGLSEVGMRRQVKAVFAKSERYKGLMGSPKASRPKATDVSYHLVSGRLQRMSPGEGVPELCCCDVNKAYYQAALNLGYLPRDVYERYVNLPKEKRLGLIGSIATRKHVHVYRGGRAVKHLLIEDQGMRAAWFDVCSMVDGCLKAVASALGDDFLFYWVDGVYFTGGDAAEEKVVSVASSAGFDLKRESVRNLARERVVMANGKERGSDSVTVERLDEATGKWSKKEFCLFKGEKFKAVKKNRGVKHG
jgi:hypothetical protein